MKNDHEWTAKNYHLWVMFIASKTISAAVTIIWGYAMSSRSSMFCLGSHVLFWLPALQGLPVVVQEGGSPLPVVPHQFPLLLQARVDFSLVFVLHRLHNNCVRELNLDGFKFRG